jgi:peptide/nickel transport system substrate-binding protein
MQRRQFVWSSFILAVALSAQAWAADTPKAGGTIRLAIPGDMTFFNGNQGPAPGYNTFWVWNNIFNGLVTVTPPPELKVVPELAKSWEILEDGKIYIFHLLEGVKFHDSTDFDAAAAKWNFDRILNPEIKSWVRVYYSDIDTVEAVDKYTLRITMKKPSVLLPALAGYFNGIPMLSPTSVEAHGKDWVRKPVGTGPFKLKELIPGDRIVLEKNPEYFKKGLPLLDVAEFRVMKDPQTAMTALRAGQIDLMMRVPVKLVPLLERAKGVKVITGPELAPTVSFLNLRVKPFDDIRARRAIGGYGLDRNEIAKVAFQGRTKPLVSVLPSGVPDAVDLNEMYPYNPEKAKELLKELGYDKNNPLSFTILVGNHDATLADVAALVKNQMAKIDVDAKINLMDATAVVDRVLVKHEFELYISSFGSLVDINMRSVSFFHGVQSDYMGINDRNLEAMVYKWRETLDEGQRRKISEDIQRLLADQLYWINATGYPFFQAYQEHVKDYVFYDQTAFLLEKVWLKK